MEKVRIKNISNYKLLITLPNARYRRDLLPGQTTPPLSEDVFEEFNYDPGCRSWVRNGFLAVLTESEELREQMVAAPKNAEVDVVKIMTEGTVVELSKLLKDSTQVIQDKVVDTAIKHNITDAARCALIKTYCGVDVLAAIANQRAMNE